ncbi:MAG TPA: helix-turn-helix domain-containing protein [Steroidobacteraceae bacterium]|nr:helix-turn-helix domain-containing protein [Steroidobacteraceae bacterium]
MGRSRSKHFLRSGPAVSPIPAFFLYGERLQAPNERLIHVETIAARSKLHDWTIQPHRHRDLHQILLLTRGRAEVRLDGSTNKLNSPIAIVVPPGIVHSFAFQIDSVGLVISFAPRLARDLAAPSGGLIEVLGRPGATALHRRSLAATDLGRLGQMLLREFGRSAPGRHAALRGLLGALLANLLRLLVDTAPESTAAGRPARELVARFRALIEERFRTRDTLSCYAVGLAVSEATLRRACLAELGQTPIELLHLRRLVEAERQLRYTSMPVAQIAYYLGFDDPAYFSRFFTRQMGVSPRAFRARDRSDLQRSAGE